MTIDKRVTVFVAAGSGFVTGGHVSLMSGRAVERAPSNSVLAYGALAALATVAVVVNSLALVDRSSAPHWSISAFGIWVSELTSLISTLALAPAVFWLARRLRPPRFPLNVSAALHLCLTVPFSFAHVAIMVGLRHIAHQAAGLQYEYAPDPLYEWRKDSFVYLVMLLLLYLSSAPGKPATREPKRNRCPAVIVVKGRDVRRLPVQAIESVEAAGNYVELQGEFGTILHRSTMAAIEVELLEAGFVRIHRSRLVRIDAVQHVTRCGGNRLLLRLAGGREIEGSRRLSSDFLSRFSDQRS